MCAREPKDVGATATPRVPPANTEPQPVLHPLAHDDLLVKEKTTSGGHQRGNNGLCHVEKTGAARLASSAL